MSKYVNTKYATICLNMQCIRYYMLKYAYAYIIFKNMSKYGLDLHNYAHICIKCIKRQEKYAQYMLNKNMQKYSHKMCKYM